MLCWKLSAVVLESVCCYNYYGYLVLCWVLLRRVLGVVTECRVLLQNVRCCYRECQVLLQRVSGVVTECWVLLQRDEQRGADAGDVRASSPQQAEEGDVWAVVYRTLPSLYSQQGVVVIHSVLVHCSQEHC